MWLTVEHKLIIVIEIYFRWELDNIRMVVIIGFEGSANKIGIGIIEDGKVRSIRGRPNYTSYFVWTVSQLSLVNKGMFSLPIECKQTN